jgi:hypothetical protein
VHAVSLCARSLLPDQVKYRIFFPDCVPSRHFLRAFAATSAHQRVWN